MGSLAACALQVQEQETDESKCKYKRLIGKNGIYVKKKVRKGACGGDDGDVREEILSSTKESEKNNKSN